MNIDGRWEGVYVHAKGPKAYHPFTIGGDQYAISAELRVQGGRVTGTMTDEERVFEVTLPQMMERDRDTMSPNTAHGYAEFSAAHPEALLTIEYPAQSDLSGRLEGDRLTFVKEYRGTLQQTFNLGRDKRTQPVQTVSMSTVHYSGVVINEALIEGTWVIRKTGPLGRWLPPTDSGQFRLRRNPVPDL